ncbi:MAG: hypothetical protein AABX10_03030 [Nanoarchaeota archaeon]
MVSQVLDLEKIVEDKLQNPTLKNNPFAGFFIAAELKKRNGLIHLLRPTIELVEEMAGVAPPNNGANFMGIDTFMRLHSLLREDVESGDYEFFLPEGLYLAGKEMQREGFQLNLHQAHSYTNKPHNFAHFVRMPRSKIKKKFSLRTIDLSIPEVDRIVEFLRRKYEEDKDGFFKTYGDKNGALSLAEELSKERKWESGIRRLNSLVGDGEMLARMIGAKDKRFSSSWNPQVNYLSMAELQTVRDHLQASFREDPDRFYAVYGSPAGIYILARELKTKISPNRLSPVLIDPEVAKRTIGIQDENFEKRWRLKTISGAGTDQLDDVVDHLRDAYKTDQENFFKRYGSTFGTFRLAEDMANKRAERGDTDYDVNLGSLTSLTKDGQTLASILGVNDRRFSTEWRPRAMGLKFSRAVDLVEFLRASYHGDADGFFARYGSSNGMHHLMSDLRKEDCIPKGNMTDVKKFTGKGELVAELLEIDDPRFRTEWNPRSLTVNGEQVGEIAGFLGYKYRVDPQAFFARYGTELGILHLEEDLGKERGLTLSPFRLGTVVKKGNSLESLLGVEDERFRTEWNPRSIQVGKGVARRIGSFLRAQYDQDRMKFFFRYAGPIGQYNLSKDLRENERLGVPLTTLGSVCQTPAVVSSLTGIPIDELNGKWNNKRILVSERDLDLIGDFVKEEYEAGPDQFFEAYGQKNGTLALIDKIRKKKKIKPNLHSITHLLADGRVLACIAGVDDDRFETQWQVARIQSSRSQTAPAVDYLRGEFSRDPEGFVNRYGSRIGVYNLATDLRNRGLLSTIDLTHLGTLLEKDKIQGVIGVEDQRIDSERWKPRQIHFNVGDFEALRENLRMVYEADPEGFVKNYAGPMGLVVVAGEAKKYNGLELTLDQYRSLVADPEFVAVLVDGDPDKLKEVWREKYALRFKPGKAVKFHDLERKVKVGTSWMAKSAELPTLAEGWEDEEYDHLDLRYGLRTLDQDGVLYVAQLYDEDRAEKILKNMNAEVKKDKATLQKLKSVKNEDDVRQVGERPFTDAVGRLLYSFDPEVRQGAKNKVIEVYSPFVQRFVEGKQNGDVAWDYFNDYAGRFDLFNVSGNKRTNWGTFTVGSLIKSVVTKMIYHPTKSRTQSLNLELGESGNKVGDLIS